MLHNLSSIIHVASVYMYTNIKPTPGPLPAYIFLRFYGNRC